MKTVAACALAAVLLATAACDSSRDETIYAAHGWTWNETDGGTRTTRGEFAVGGFVKLADVARLPGVGSHDQIAEGCLLAEERDGIATVWVTMTNRGARTTLTARVGQADAVIYGTDMATELLLATGGEDGVACDPLARSGSPDEGWRPSWPDVPHGRTTEPAYGYIVIRDYFVADSPKGSAELLLSRSFVEVDDGREDTWLTSLDGPSATEPLVFESRRFESGGFALSGTRPPCGTGDMVVRCKP